MKNNNVAIGVILMASFLLSGCAWMSGRETAGQYIDDTTLTTRIKDRILKDPDLKGSQIHVESFQGEVQLSGFVDSVYEKLRAYKVASQTSGTKFIRNDVVVREKIAP
jgi:osmotically-inducible protein OsmY